MKISLLFATILLFVSFFAEAQNNCLPEGITFTTQEQIDNFKDNFLGCTEIEGSVIIKGNSIINLDGLNVITTILGGLEIGGSGFGNPLLTHLAGLENLTYVGGILQLRNNQVLNSIEALSSLEFIGDYLVIDKNPSLSSLVGLEGIHTAKGVAIYDNAMLESLTSLENLNYIELELFIGINNSLKSLDGLDNIDTVAGLVDIYNNPQLKDLNGLKGLKYIGDYLWISRNDSIKDLDGLVNLTKVVGYIKINSNFSLTSLSGLENVSANSITDLSIYDNPALTQCALDNICSYLSAPGGIVEIYWNAPGCNSIEEVEEDCDNQSIAQQPIFSFIIYPSPADNGSITLTLDNPYNLHLICFNTYGQQVHQQMIRAEETIIDVSTWAPGIYLAVVYEDGKPVGRSKFVVR